MADVNYSVSYRVSKDFLNASVSAGNATSSMSVAGLLSQTLTLTTSAVSISTANLGSVGLAFFQNLSTHTASTCTVGIDAGGSFVGFATLKAGEPAILRLTAGTAYSARGATGARLRVDILEG
jgi:hypothetical protein